MAFTLADAVVYFRGDDRKLAGDLDAAERKTNSAAGNMAKLLGGAVVGAATAAGAALVGIGVAATSSFISFQDKMNEVFTLLPGISQQGMDEMTAQVKTFAKEYGVLPEKVVPALYQAISAGVPADNVFSFLATSVKAAKGGVTELETAVDGISSVVNAYHSETLDATKASDLMFTAVKLGKTDFGQLAGSLFNVIPTAASLGVEFGNITAALAAMTAQGTPTSVATTQLRQLLVELSQDGSKASKTFQEMAGESFVDFIASGKNVQDALVLMEGAAQNSDKRLSDLFSSVEAGNAALALTGSGAKTFSDDLAAMDAAAGATDTAFGTMQTGIQASIDKLKAGWAAGLLDLGEKLSPFVADVVDVATPAVIGALEAVGTAVEELQKLWNEDFAEMKTTYNEWRNEVLLNNDEFLEEWKKTFGEESQGIQFTWEDLFRNLLKGEVESQKQSKQNAVTWLRLVRGEMQIWTSLIHGDWAGFWAGVEFTSTTATNAILDWIFDGFGQGMRQAIGHALDEGWAAMKEGWQKMADWWNNTVGPYLGVTLPAGRDNLGIVNPIKQEPAWRRNYQEIYAPGQLDALRQQNNSTRTINIQPGAITINESARPGATGDELEDALINLLELP